jgi:iron complex outermembrane receptor protein
MAMRRLMKRWLASAFLSMLLIAAAGLRPAQAGAIRGTVLNADTRAPLFAASVLVTSLRDPSLRLAQPTDRQGAFAVRDLPAGTYEVRASLVGFDTFVLDEVAVGADSDVTLELKLTELAVAMETMIVSASRREERALDAPASVQVLGEGDLADKPVLTPADYLAALPAVDVARAGLNQGTVVVRGFNNVFSGATLTLVDNRIARVPSLRYNALNFIPTTNDDIERIEVVSGPGSALYGPNAANGVVHMITRSPFDHPGTTLSVSGGERDVFIASGSHAGAPMREFAYRISSTYYQGNDFEYVDPVEAAERQDAIDEGADPATLKIGARDYNIRKAAVDARLDFLPANDVSLTFNGGWNRIDAIELTGLGAAQADGFQYAYGQVRLRWRDLFWQAYLNRSDAGDTYNLRTGADFVDQSSFIVTQLQHQWRPDEERTLTYGADVLLTRPDTEGTINGRNEGDDDINEIGGYLQAENRFLEHWSLTTAVRVDDNNRLKDPVFSPRAALVFEPGAGHRLRGTYNRAFSTPTPNNYFLDLVVLRDLGGFEAATGGLADGYDLYTKGVPEDGFTFRRDAMGGLDGLYMQVPQAIGGTGASVAADATLLWPAVVQILAAQGTDISMIPQPTAASVSSVLRVLNPTTASFDPVDPAYVQNVEEMQPTINNTFEVGYKGVLGGRFSASVDVWHSRIKDFIGPLRVETPNVFYDPATLGAYLSNPAFGLSPAQVQALTAAIATIPVGTVTPDGAEDPADLFLTYRNFGDVDLTGFDVGVSWFAIRNWTLGASYSFASKDFFEDAGGASDIALNAPQHKVGANVQWHDDAMGLTAGLRGRWIDTFPVLSGAFNGPVERYTVVDLNAAWDLPKSPGTTLSARPQRARRAASRVRRRAGAGTRRRGATDPEVLAPVRQPGRCRSAPLPVGRRPLSAGRRGGDDGTLGGHSPREPGELRRCPVTRRS